MLLKLVARCRNQEQYPLAEADARVTVMRIDAPIYFANVEYIKDFIRKGHRKVSNVQSFRMAEVVAFVLVRNELLS